MNFTADTFTAGDKVRWTSPMTGTWEGMVVTGGSGMILVMPTTPFSQPSGYIDAAKLTYIGR